MRLFPATVLAAILVLMLAAPAAASGDPEPRLDEQILWMDAEQQFALFLPERVTASREVSELPLKAYQQRILAEKLASFRERGGTGPCIPSDNQPEQGTAANARSMEDLLAERRVSLVGRIEQLVGGWTPWTQSVVTAAYLRVQQVLHGADEPGAPSVGDRIAIFYRGGTTTVEGMRLCGTGLTGFHQPAEGDRVVLAGSPWESDDRFFMDFVRFPMLGGEVQPQPRADLAREQLPVDLKELESKLQEGQDWREEQ